MSLTMGSAPFGIRPAGTFNFERRGPETVLYFEECPRRVRGIVAGEVVVSSRRVKMLHESGHLPVWYFPIEDVRMELLQPSGHSTRCPFKGKAAYWSIRTAGRVVENAAWSYPEPAPGAPPLAGYVAFDWNALDSWLEEDEEVFVHPRDPYHRIDAIESSRRVRVRLDGVLLAESRRPVMLFETGLPPRHYLRPQDVRGDLLRPSQTTTRCPYKGIASYHDASAGGEAGRDLVWTYREPLPEAAKIAGLLCFFDERIDLETDGEPQPRPSSPWAPNS